MSMVFYESGKRAFEAGSGRQDYPWELSKKQKKEWQEGWDDARKESEVVKAEEEWAALATECPWFVGDYRCSATNETCSKYNCAPYYFHKKLG